MGISTAIGIGIQFSRGGGQSWESIYKPLWEAKFTGVPIEYESNPLTIDDCLFRAILKINGIYHIFEEVIDTDWYIQKRTSLDGITMGIPSGNLFSYGTAGTFDEKGQADPTVIYDGVGDWKMWFDAKNGSNVWDKIGYATSVDGDTWTKYGAILSRGASGAWDDAFVHHPAVIKYNGVYYMFYAGAKTGDVFLYKIGLATSTDGINWTKYASNPVILNGLSGEWDDLYVRPSCPVLIYGKWYMWYWGNPDQNTCHMGLATSPDLYNWTKVGRVLTPTNGASGSMPILRSGSNPLDKIVQIWFTNNADTLKLNFAKASIYSGGDKLNGFTLTAGNVYQIALTTEPVRVYFNGVAGTKKTSVATVNAEYNWYWESDVLYIYSDELADVRYQIYYLNDPLGTWAINETSGNVIDGMGLHNGTPSNVIQQVTGGVFNGTNSKIDLGNNFNFERTDKFSICCSVKRVGLGGTSFIFSKSLAAGNYTGFGMYFQTDNKINFSLVSTVANSIQKATTTIFTDTENFIHLCYTYDGSSTAEGLKLYKDGVLQTATTAVDNLTNSIITVTPFLIGSRNSLLGANAVIKNFGIYNTVFNATDIAKVIAGTYPD